jgi:hypothetical protein
MNYDINYDSSDFRMNYDLPGHSLLSFRRNYLAGPQIVILLNDSYALVHQKEIIVHPKIRRIIVYFWGCKFFRCT